MTGSDTDDTERRVLLAMKNILTRVARETATPPGTRHVLSEQTIEQIRQCLALISVREMELSESDGEISEQRPRYPGQRSRRDKIKVSVDSILGEGDKNKH
ncbi:MAG: segregation and condensation protein A [Proteobacteria bacterium]|nr:MAG: segregation and condensation protein A [Pseudomonadota bacterium]